MHPFRGHNRIDTFFGGLIAFLLAWNAVQLTLLYTDTHLYAHHFHIFVVTDRNPYYLWTYLTAIYSHSSILHLGINLTTLIIAWAYLRQTPHRYSTRLLTAFITIVPLITVVASAAYGHLIKPISFVGASTFTYALLTFALLNNRITPQKYRTVEHTVVIATIITLFTRELVLVAGSGLEAGNVTHITGIIIGIVLTVWFTDHEYAPAYTNA